MKVVDIHEVKRDIIIIEQTRKNPSFFATYAKDVSDSRGLQLIDFIPELLRSDGLSFAAMQKINDIIKACHEYLTPKRARRLLYDLIEHFSVLYCEAITSLLKKCEYEDIIVALKLFGKNNGTIAEWPTYSSMQQVLEYDFPFTGHDVISLADEIVHHSPHKVFLLLVKAAELDTDWSTFWRLFNNIIMAKSVSFERYDLRRCFDTIRGRLRNGEQCYIPQEQIPSFIEAALLLEDDYPFFYSLLLDIASVSEQPRGTLDLVPERIVIDLSGIMNRLLPVDMAVETLVLALAWYKTSEDRQRFLNENIYALRYKETIVQRYEELFWRDSLGF